MREFDVYGKMKIDNRGDVVQDKFRLPSPSSASLSAPRWETWLTGFRFARRPQLSRPSHSALIGLKLDSTCPDLSDQV
jgi:hypothetical protein